MRHSVSHPQAYAGGFIPVGGNGANTPHHAKDLRGRTAPSPSSSTTSNRYNILMENALESVKEQASALEEAAMERHRRRMERARQEISMAIEDAVDQISEASAREEQGETIQSFCDQHSADMMDMFDNFTGEAERLRLEVLGRLQDGVIEDRGGIPIEDEAGHSATGSTTTSKEPTNVTASKPGT
jgi:acyl-CoA reductase-like NAD-dependent aldehyde dehydrogenase